MANSSQPVISITKLEQVCIVVHDIDRSMESLWGTFGIGPWNVFVIDSSVLNEMTYRGKPARFSFKMARTQHKVGGFEIELIEPLEGDSIYRDFLRDHGEGIHHVGWHLADSPGSLTETVRSLEKAGFPCLMSGRSADAAFAYIDTTKALNTTLELFWLDPSATPLRPIRVFPE
jgi:methylmalonyl-CoA/ethylmalonyl-CoA epimerase